MEIDGVLENVDKLYSENRSIEAEGLLLDSAAALLEENDEPNLLRILNELLGLYRETSQFEKAYGIARNAILVADNFLPEESIPYATTLLNVATVYRTGGRLDESLECYKRVEKIYSSILTSDSMLFASLYNNEALLFQELGDFDAAKDRLEKALSIVTLKGEVYEEAVSRANLAGTYIQLGKPEAALDQAKRSIALFEEQGVEDQHLCAAYSALGSYHYINGEFETAAGIFKKAMDIMERALGRNAYYERLAENHEACLAATSSKGAYANGISADRDDPVGSETGDTGAGFRKGADICRAYYESYGALMIRSKFPEYEGKIAVGLAGEGSDAFGYDDASSADHDWGPSFCMWVSDETYDAIGEELRKAYDELPDEFEGIKRARTAQGASRRGVCRIGDFYGRLIGAKKYEDIDWTSVSDASLAAAVNGEVYRDDEGVFTAFRDRLKEGYPEHILYAKLAESCGRFSQTGQYNYFRMKQRGDLLTADMMLSDAIREAMKIGYYMNGLYPPHDKWLRKGLESVQNGDELLGLIERMKREPDASDMVGAFIALCLYKRGLISDIDSYIDHHTEELIEKSLYSRESNDELAMDIARMEFAAFDKVQNEGGRASCQDDWPTFQIMRRSQYLTWSRAMLLQYIYDFDREMRLGHNLITEKYGRMMEYTAPEKYEEIKDNFPALSEEKRAIIDQIVMLQVQWMEEFASEYPLMASRARTIHTYEESAYDTSYETYLRGEISTYSDKMLELYAGFIVEHAKSGSNLARETMEISAKLYGYESLDAAEKFLKM